jgi:hypothetical protein
MSSPNFRSMLGGGSFTAAFIVFASMWASSGPVVGGSNQEVASKLPTAEAILDRYIEVTGGRTAYKSIHNILSRGTFQLVGMPSLGKYTAYEAEPNKTRTIFDFDGGEKDEQGTIEDIAWEKSSRAGPRLIEGEEKAVAMRESTFNSMLNWRNLYTKAECVGTEKVGERACYKVVLAPAVGKPLTQYFDIESGLLLKSFIILTSPAGEIRSENLYDDYRKENVEVLFPHKLVHRIVNEEMVILLESVRCNVDIAWYRFDLPPEVKALTLSRPRE